MRRTFTQILLHPRGQWVASSNVTSDNNEQLPQYADFNAGQIYKALISAADRRSMVLFSSSVQPSDCSLRDSDMPDAAFRNALDNFRKTNTAAWHISPLIGGGREITKTAHDSMFNKFDAATGKNDVAAGWKEFHRRYWFAKGILAVSAVGFDAGRTVAIVYSEMQCGGLCGTGSFKYFRRTPHGWDRVEAAIPSCEWIE